VNNIFIGSFICITQKKRKETSWNNKRLVRVNGLVLVIEVVRLDFECH